jgi:hypothetical protein
MQSRGTTTNAFVRLPVPSVGQILVESKCQCCGSRIVSSVFEGLEEMEAEHRIKCSGLPEKMGTSSFEQSDKDLRTHTMISLPCDQRPLLS